MLAGRAAAATLTRCWRWPPVGLAMASSKNNMLNRVSALDPNSRHP
jgi:hypothetical protein